jgi:hypothetical protein
VITVSATPTEDMSLSADDLIYLINTMITSLPRCAAESAALRPMPETFLND